MKLRWTERQRKIAEVILKHRKNDGYDFTAVRQELPEMAKGSISKVAKELKLNDWQIPGETELTETEIKLAEAEAQLVGKEELLKEIKSQLKGVEKEKQALLESTQRMETIAKLNALLIEYKGIEKSGTVKAEEIGTFYYWIGATGGISLEMKGEIRGQFESEDTRRLMLFLEKVITGYKNAYETNKREYELREQISDIGIPGLDASTLMRMGKE